MTSSLTAGISDAEYHGDKGSLSSSGARRILKCPALFRWEQDNPPPPRPEFDFGHLAHRLVLGEGSAVTLLDPQIHGLKRDGTVADNPKATTAWKQAESEARARGEVPVHVDDYDAAVAMARAVRNHPVAAALFENGQPELSGAWTDPDTGVKCRYRPDWLTTTTSSGRTICVDYKTSVSADPRDFARSCATYGYHQQQAWYETGLTADGHTDPGFVFVVQQKTPPYPVSVVELHADAVMLGARLNRRAIDLYAKCVADDMWPAYGDQIHLIDLPGYVYSQENIA